MYYFLSNNGVEIYTPNGDGVDADTWEISVCDELKNAIIQLENHPDSLVEFAGDETKEDVKGRAKEAANFLREGLESAEKNGYDWIIIDWF